MTITITWRRVVLAAMAAVLLGLAVGWSGAVNVAASSGHWKVTEWFLHWVMRNSVKTRSYWESPREAADASGLVSAAGHYAGACANCHGAPGVRFLAVNKAATPIPPDLAVNAKQWGDRHLHWILTHGVKFSGMPSWPARHRPDEVARMVAFVRRLPAMTPAQYQQLTGGSARVAGTNEWKACVGCHGTDGRGRGPDVPVLGGQQPAYLRNALHQYQSGARESAVMGNAAAKLSEADMLRYALRFAAMPGLGGTASARDPLVVEIIERGLPQFQLPACASCHAPGKPYPVLRGQKAAYIAGRLRRWRGPEEVVDARKSHATMPVIARRIPSDMIDRLARHYEAAR
jgi:cytochrome c553